MDKHESEGWQPLVGRLYEQSIEKDFLNEVTDEESHLAALVHHFHAPSERYEVGESIGRGGWKEVFLAFDKHCGREVAYAVPLDPASPEVVEAFLREARIIASLEHPGIISFYTLGLTDEGVPFYAMEKQLGGSLQQALQQGKLNAEQALEIFLQVCHAIGYAHLMGIVHLDLKPENIQIGSHGVVKVCDWGLSAAILRPPDERKVVTGFYDLCGDNGDFSKAAGTPGYLAPERKSRRAPAAPSADIFSLGVILKEIASLYPKGSRRRITAIAGRACAESRYSSVEELQADLRKFQSQFPSSVEPGGLFSRFGLFARRNQMAISYAAACCALVAALGVLSLAQNERTQREVNVALSAKLKAQELQFQAETDAQDAQAMRVKDAYAQSFVLLDLVVLNPSLGEQAVNESITILTEALSEAPEDESSQLALNQLGIAYFLNQRFYKAAEAFSASGRDADLEEIARRFANHPRRKGVLSLKSFIELLRAIPPNRSSLQQKMVFYDRALRENWNEEVQISLAWIENKNPKWSAKSSQWHFPDRTLILRGRGLETLAEAPEKFTIFRKNILDGLDLDSLIFEGTGYLAYGQLKSLRLKTLDLSGEPYSALKNPKVLGPEVKIIRP